MAEADRWGNKRTLPCGECGRLRYPGGKRASNLCRDCKKKQPKERSLEHGRLTTYDRGGCRCELCRGAKREAMRSYVARRKAAGEPVDWAAYKPKESKTCPTCGQMFVGRLDVTFCSRGCNPRVQLQQTRSARWRRMSVRGRAFRTRAEKLAADAATGTTGGGMVWVNGPCAVCGRVFLSAGVSSRYCSKECRAVVRSLRTDWIDWRTRREIYIRDRWECQICRRPSLLGAKDDSRPTLDHIIPRSRGGSHEVSNLRLLCSRCNSKRGDLTYYSDEDVRRAFSA